MKFVLLTCDTEIGETPGDLKDPFNILIEGNISGQKVGYTLINDLARKYGGSVTHFIDVFSAQQYGIGKFQTLCETILSEGHQIGLHTHPSKTFDPSRKWMYQYNLSEQRKILSMGQDILYHWTGHEILSHRAGGYGADDVTIQALSQVGFKIDCSYYVRHPNCKISSCELNNCFYIMGIWEIPITVCAPYGTRSLTKLDWRYSIGRKDIISVIKQAPDKSIITIFLHSFNFLNLVYDFKKGTYSEISVNKHLIEEYEKILSAIHADQNCKFASIDSLEPKNANCSFLPKLLSISYYKKRIQQKYYRLMNQKIHM
jgi:peptidoglycan/xylan/chitin deacetylase (PgdA/CDA1 family)